MMQGIKKNPTYCELPIYGELRFAEVLAWGITANMDTSAQCKVAGPLAAAGTPMLIRRSDPRVKRATFLLQKKASSGEKPMRG